MTPPKTTHNGEFKFKPTIFVPTPGAPWQCLRIANSSRMDSDSDDHVDSSEGQSHIDLICECEELHLENDDCSSDEDELSSFQRSPGDICWVNVVRGGVPVKCASDDLVTVFGKTDNDVRTLCRAHFKAVEEHRCCWDCFNVVTIGTYLMCPHKHRTDPLCNTLKQKMDEGKEMSCSHCGSTELTKVQLSLDLKDSDESVVAEFTKLIEDLEKADKSGVQPQASEVNLWRERMHKLSPDLLTAYRQAPQELEELATRMYSVLSLIDDEDFDHLIAKMVDLQGVAKPNDLMTSAAEALEAVYFEGDLPFTYTAVVTDPDKLTEIADEKAIMFCDCIDVCDPATCSCCSGVYGTSTEEDPEEREAYIPDISVANPSVSECGPACACRNDCGNRLVQNGGKRYPLELIDTKDRGLGVRAKAEIPKGRFIIEYTGTLRELVHDDVTNNYCFETVMGLTRMEIDASERGSIARCVNHSCKPNAVIVKVAWEPMEARRLFHLAIFALEKIDEGREITIDYGDAFWFAKMDEFACVCGSDACRHDEAARQDKLRQFMHVGTQMEEEEEVDDEEVDEDEDEEESEMDDSVDDDDDEVVAFEDEDDEANDEEEEVNAEKEGVKKGTDNNENDEESDVDVC